MSPRGNSKFSLLNAWFTRLDDEQRPLLLSGRFRIVLLALLLISLLLANLITSAGHGWLNGLAILIVLILLWTVWRELLQPLLRLSDWADAMRAVNLDAQVEFNPDSEFAELARDINMLGHMINQLSLETEAQLEKHTDYISRESRSLAILYDVASSINLSKDLNELFQKSLSSLCGNLNASAGIIRQFKTSNDQDIVALVGEFNQTFLASVDRLLPLNQANANTEIQRLDSLTVDTVLAESHDFNSPSLTVFSVPVPYRDATLGMIHLFFGADLELEFEDYNELLLSIGQHLGTAVEKFRLLEEENQLLIIQERTRLSHELHDSLAQTLAGLRIQLRLVDDSLQSRDAESSLQELKKIEHTMEQANNQVRELIAHFRVPMTKRDLIESIEDAIQQCREEADISIHFHNEWLPQEIPPEIQFNVLRIVQEILANVRKHSQAHIVRVLLTHRGDQHTLLIEDDGIGFDESSIVPEPGRRLGLNILRDRAQQINGNITIDSEPGEGTRIRLQFNLEDQG